MKIRPQAVCKCLLQSERLVFKQDILFHVFISIYVESHHFAFPTIYELTVFQMLHDDYDYQRLDYTFALA